MSWDRLLEGVWASSWSAAVIILAVLSLRGLFQSRTPRRVFCLLWDLALTRLLLLAPLPSPVSVWRWAPAASPALLSGVSHAAARRAAAPVTEIVAGDAAAAPGSMAAPSALPPDGGVVLAAVWLTVALALASWFLWSHLRSRHLYADSLPREDAFVRGWLSERPLRRKVQIRTSDRVAAPLTYGVLRPVILLPAGVDRPDRAVLSCVLEHEYQHIRRFDTARKGLLAAVLCLHWFNPLVWTLYVLSNRDMELACDEAVTAQGMDRAEYARTLLDMEEQRGRWGLSGSHFSQNAMEERIRCIMKHKKTSTFALAMVLVVMTIAVTVFASAAPEEKAETPSRQDVPEIGYVYDHLGLVEDIGVGILSKGGEDGEKLYSVDGGRSWMSEERYQAEYGSWGDDWQVEWWTYEDYKAWLEEEKLALQSIIGERAYTSTDGWFTWDQKKVDEAIALYEGILEDIKNGALYSKTITDKNGDEVEDVALGSDGPLNAAVTSVFEEGEDVLAAPSETVDEDALLEELRAFGVSGSGGELTYNGRRIRRLVDGAPVGDDGYSIRYLYSNPDGEVDVHTLRSVTHNPDGSYDPMGKLAGVAAEGDRGFDRSLIDSAAFSGGNPMTGAEGNSGGKGRTFEEIFAQYSSYGLVYFPRESAMGSLTWNGQAVKSFADLKPDGGAFSYQDPYGSGGLRVYTEYDAGGRLTGLRGE